MDEQEIKDPEKKAFFQTLPGIFTGIAGLITALGGFLIVLNKVGCMDRKISKAPIVTGQTHAGSPYSQSDTGIIKNQDDEEVRPGEGSKGKQVVTFSPAEVKNFSTNLIFKIKEATIQTSGDNAFFDIKIKCLNESKSDYFFYSAYIRVKSGEDKYAPDQTSPSIDRQQISSQGFGNLEYNFKLPKGITDFLLLLFDDYSSADPITFKVN